MINPKIIEIILYIGSSLLTLQGVVTLIWMLYAWEDPKTIKRNKAPRKFSEKKYSFTALLPVRHEEQVVEDTIRAINNIDYPTHLKEIIIVLRHDDPKTIEKAQNITAKIGNENIKLLILVDSHPINKPISLNFGLQHATNQIITIFDAEDEPHPDIYNIVNTVIQTKKADVVQCGVQLINYDSYWFSPLNVMEYFLWFKSGLHFFSKIGGVSPLGGNTVFFKKEFLQQVNGWDENSLTEDADIGIRLSAMGAVTKIVYDEVYATKEETPNSTESFIKQRTRWHQGFLQIFLKGNWLKLPTLKQKIFIFFILLSPFLPAFFLFYIPFGIYVNFAYKLPIVNTMYSYIPFYIVLMIIVVQITGLYEFTRSYGFRFRVKHIFLIILSYFPYLALLTFSALRATYRIILSNSGWEKTAHINAHRQVKKYEVVK